MTVTLLMSHPGNMPGYTNPVDLDEAQSLSSDYSYPPPGMASNAPNIFSFPPIDPSVDLLNGSSWASNGEGQSFPDFPDTASPNVGDVEECLFTSGQTTPRGTRTDRPKSAEAIWTASRTGSVATTMAQAMSRANSSRSSTTVISQNSHMSAADDAAAFQNGSHSTPPMAGMDSCLLLVADAGGPNHLYWPDYSIDVGLNANHQGVYHLPGADPLHMAPAHMHLGPEVGLPDASSPSSWDCFSSSISRTSSPATIDETWMPAPLSSRSSPDIKCQSPSSERKLTLIPEYDNISANPMDDSIGLTQKLGPRRPSNVSDSARDHVLYKSAAPGPDGFFHCPWEGQANCNHKAEKLKCNYDKFVDSHLKPYRCKAITCEGARFSSTACLLRHEREAHGLHGHGEKPFLCIYDGCERAMHGNGFPRQWNLRDHMKRVHNDHGISSGSPPAAAVPVSQPVNGSRKRKLDAPEQQVSASRKTVVKPVPMVEQVRNTTRPLLDQWLDHRRAVEDAIRGLNKPGDSRNLRHITRVQKHLSAMAKMTADNGDMPKADTTPVAPRRSYASG
ncbi:hypothetical protein RJ55_03042 [Drechmeria coniospora]|nr:hypothetical protein RJ55_03042 [Drechmeria coniospora]